MTLEHVSSHPSQPERVMAQPQVRVGSDTNRTGPHPTSPAEIASSGYRGTDHHPGGRDGRDALARSTDSVLARIDSALAPDSPSISASGQKGPELHRGGGLDTSQTDHPTGPAGLLAHAYTRAETGKASDAPAYRPPETDKTAKVPIPQEHWKPEAVQLARAEENQQPPDKKAQDRAEKNRQTSDKKAQKSQEQQNERTNRIQEETAKRIEQAQKDAADRAEQARKYEREKKIGAGIYVPREIEDKK